MDKTGGSGHTGRRLTREVMVGDVGIGGTNPVRVQSMTSMPTSDNNATVEQIIRLAGAGAEIARMTVQSIREARNLENIRSELINRKCIIPLVADVHFNPSIAEIAATLVDKVRINPGNYGISPGSRSAGISDKAYMEELHRAKTAFSRLLNICRQNGTALRIGVNHGSLSPRIINRYGNTPAGMVNSAMEFLQFCREENFHNVVVSLKSSNTKVMVGANRLMVLLMEKEGMEYPLHLGVTEAGEGEDGRIRSVTGIGTLLGEGIGDTIRVSLTEDPEREIPVARNLIMHIERQLAGIAEIAQDIGKYVADNGSFGPSGEKSTLSAPVLKIGGGQVPVVICSENGTSKFLTDQRGHAGKEAAASNNDDAVSETTDNTVPGTSDDEVSETNDNEASAAGDKSIFTTVQPDFVFDPKTLTAGGFPVIDPGEYLERPHIESLVLFLQATIKELSGEVMKKAAEDRRVVFVARSQSACPPAEMKKFIDRLRRCGCSNPVVFRKHYKMADLGDFQIAAAADFSPLFIDGIGDGLWLEYMPADIAVSTSFSILQSTRVRTTKTEFISCPSCGRTMFNIQKATAAVKLRTSHLRGLKIAVMGCIVNGPGEMADADYGYVGSGKGRVTLYKKQTVVRRNIPEEKAIEELIDLIRENGDWRDED